MEGKSISVSKFQEEELDELGIQKPKKPPSAYFLFIKEQSQQGVKVNLSKMGELWRELSQENKAKYVTQSEELKSQYNDELALFNQKMRDLHLVDINLQNKEQKEKPSIYGSHVKRLAALVWQKKSRKRIIPQKSIEFIQKSATIFLKEFGEKVGAITKSHKRKTIQKKDLIEAISSHEKYWFIQNSKILDEEFPNAKKSKHKKQKLTDDQVLSDQIEEADEEEEEENVISNNHITEEKQ